MQARRFFKVKVSTTLLRGQIYKARVYSRQVFSQESETWESCRDKGLALAIKGLEGSPLRERAVITTTLISNIRAAGIDTDTDAALDLLRLACATGKIAVIPLMIASGYPSETFVSLATIDELSKLKVIIAGTLEKVGWLSSEGLCRLSVENSLTADTDSAELVLSHAAARGLGEYDGRGLFYRRPFLRESN